jgi:predicted secreted protein
MPAGYSSFGTQFQISDGAATPVFATIANVMDISGPEYTLDTEEVTSHSSTGGYKEYLPTLKDGGNVSFDMLFINDATQASLWDAYEAREVTDFKIIFPITDETLDDTIDFSGIVTSIGINAPVSGTLRRNVTIKVTGQATWSGATP